MFLMYKSTARFPLIGETIKLNQSNRISSYGHVNRSFLRMVSLVESKTDSSSDKDKNSDKSQSVQSVAAVQLPKVPTQFADESYKLFSQIQVDDPTPEEARAVRNKCIKWILPFICVGYHIMYVDKQTVSSSQ